MAAEVVSDTQADKEVAHVSYSALNDFLSCGKYYQLKRLLNLPEKPAVWNGGGRAVHSATEASDRQLFAAFGI